MTIHFFTEKRTMKLRSFALATLAAVSTYGCMAEIDDPETGTLGSLEQEIGTECHQECDTELICTDVQQCAPQTSCGWNWSWRSYWWGGFWVPSYECSTQTVCSTTQQCEYQQVNCHDVCTHQAFPATQDVALLNALNYWSTSELQSNLSLSATVAAAITQNRIDNGGVFFGLEEVSVAGFDPNDHLNDNEVQASKDLLSLLAPQVSYNNDIEMYIDGDETLPMIVDQINSATKYVHLNTMLFFNDPAADQIAYALRDAAQRGVIVRVLFDYFTTEISSEKRSGSAMVEGTPITPGLGVVDIIESGCQPGVVCDVRSTSQETEYWVWDWYGSYWWADDVRQDLKNKGVPEYMLQMQDYIQDSTETALNVVNHQKFIIIDGERMVIGSSNLGNNYQYTEAFDGTGWRWHDGMALVTGPAAKHAQRVFAQQWFVNARGDVFDFDGPFYFGSDETLVSASGNTPMALMLSFPGDPKHINIRYIQEMLPNASSEVYMENPYPTDGLLWDSLNGLDAAHASRTHLVTSIGMTDGPTVGATARCRGQQAATNGFSLYDFYQGNRYSHLKLTVDTGKNMVHYGSYNLNSRSKLHDLELNFLVRDPQLAAEAVDIIEHDIANSGPAKAPGYYHSDTTWVGECKLEELTNWGT